MRRQNPKKMGILGALASGAIREKVFLGETELEIRTLTARQSQDAEMRAYGISKSQDYENKPEYKENLNREKILEKLAVAICVPGTDEQVFEDGLELQDHLSDDQCNKVLSAYQTLEASSEHAALSEVERLLKGKNWTELKNIVGVMPRSSLLILVNQLLISLEHRSSSTD